MRPPRRAAPALERRAPGLLVRARPRGPELYSRALATPPSLRGEPLLTSDGESFRRWDPTRSKLGAALVLGWNGPTPSPGERWLYLGAAAGTTASHVADLVGARGAVLAVEPSVRPFVRLLEVAERYPNLLPILGDARRPEEYAGSVGPVDGLYVDVAQADQAEIAAVNAAAFLRPGGPLLFVVKTSSLGREARPREALRRALDRWPPELRAEEPLDLEPFHRRHYLVAARFGSGPPPGAGPRATPGRIARRGPRPP